QLSPFFFQAEDGIRDFHVTGVQTCALPILERNLRALHAPWGDKLKRLAAYAFQHADKEIGADDLLHVLGSSALEVLVRCGLQIRSEERRVGKECRSRRQTCQ